MPNLRSRPRPPIPPTRQGLSIAFDARSLYQERGPPKIVPIKFRHYLSIVSYRRHRVALTRVLTGSHHLAVERLKWARDDTGRKLDIERPRRLCRFCKREPESPEHAVLACNAHPELISVRRDFWQRMHALPSQPLPALVLHAPSLAQQLQAIVAFKPAARLVARLAYRALEVYKTVPMFVPIAPTSQSRDN
jgi:hypothetical protein